MRNRVSLAFLFSGALLVACSDDDSFIQRPSGGLPAEVADKAELETYECSMDVIGEKVYVVDLGENYECDGDEWFRSYDQPKSSSSAKSSSSVTPKSSGATGEASPCSALPGGVCDYGTLTDSRDGQTYKTVTIGDQVWMAENLNYETENSYCYDDDPSNCAKYGRLYTYPVRGVCPSGWHLPSKTEFETLFSAVGGVQDESYTIRWNGAGTALKSTSGWNEYEGESGNGTDAFGFSALPAGYRHVDGGYGLEGNFAYFWSSTEYDSYNAYFMNLYYYRGDYADLHDHGKDYGHSVRCVKD